MAKGPRKSAIDKLRQELKKIRENISSHEEKIATLKEKESEIMEQIHNAEMESIREAMEEKGLDVESLKQILDTYGANNATEE